MTELLFFMLYTGYEWIAQGCVHDSLDSVHPVFSLFEMASILAPKDFIRDLHFLDPLHPCHRPYGYHGRLADNVGKSTCRYQLF